MRARDRRILNLQPSFEGRSSGLLQVHYRDAFNGPPVSKVRHVLRTRENRRRNAENSRRPIYYKDLLQNGLLELPSVVRKSL
jgi:hypothetical protein